MELQPKVYVEKANKTLVKVATAIGIVTVIAGGYLFYINNLWEPKLEIVSVDYAKGEAVIKSRSRTINLYGDATFALKGDWGVRLGSTHDSVYDRIEITKKGMVVDYLTV